jgi:hypothetical protein
MRKEFKITYEIFPLRALYHETVIASSQESAIEFLEMINNHRIKIVKVEEVTA